MYRLSEQKIYTRYHYVWASSRNKAYELFDEYEPVIEDTEFEPEYKEYDVEEVEDPDLIQENWPGYILNGDIEDWCEDKDA